eukprot:4844601-Pyramimonas_sp.AAC.1
MATDLLRKWWADHIRIRDLAARVPKSRSHEYAAFFPRDAPRGTYPCDHVTTGSHPEIQTAREWI